ncbi:hypothetical protein SAMN05444266_107331 [Chitinophaga jiangningensis]|uniref:Uncharacterized protein n=1 Tax=Chitinophaga jiangningensis TaxID=1419482 RepID=A0A1M7HQG3_9BACT|nr:hypothetical protein [Chitinophaga jiangningensis]SHM30659.1 hypothetical protein SAMN05444266_107331 [Chitinophaga jiangningensis]
MRNISHPGIVYKSISMLSPEGILGQLPESLADSHAEFRACRRGKPEDVAVRFPLSGSRYFFRHRHC